MTEAVLRVVDRRRDLCSVDHGAGSGGEGLDDAGDGGFGGEDLDGGVGLLAGAGHADERHDCPAGDDVLEDSVEFGGVSSVEARGELGDQLGAGEDLVVGEQPTIDVEDLAGEPVDLSVGQRESQRRVRVWAAARCSTSRSTGHPNSASSCCQVGSSSSTPV